MQDELTLADLRRHPVSQVLMHAALGALPSAADLDDLRLPDADRRRLADAAVVVAAEKASGENAEARRLGQDAAERIVGALTAEQRDPDYLEEPEPDPTNPADLAAQVARR